MKVFVLFLALCALVCLSTAQSDSIDILLFGNFGDGNPVCTPDAIDETVNVTLDGSLSVIPGSGGQQVSIVANSTVGTLTYDVSFWSSDSDLTPFLIFYDIPADVCIDTVDTPPDFREDLSSNIFDFLLSNFTEGGDNGDPHFHPLSDDPKIAAMKYSPHSDRDGVYNIFTNEWFQWNQEWTIYSDIDVFHVTPQYVTKEAFVIAHPLMIPQNITAGKPFKRASKDKLVPAKISAEFVTNKEKSSLKVVVKLNGKIISLSNSKKVFLFGEAYPEYFITLRGSNSAILSTALTNVKISWEHQDFRTHIHASPEERNAPKYQWPYFNSDIKVVNIPALSNSHGLLGQTLRSDCPYRNPWNYCISCFVKGHISDYQIKDNNLFGTDFHFNLFKQPLN